MVFIKILTLWMYCIELSVICFHTIKKGGGVELIILYFYLFYYNYNWS
jgi:hypothetical protein